MTSTETGQLLTLRDVKRLTTLSSATVYRYCAAGRFPKPVRLGPNRCAWRAAEVQAWNDSPLDWGRDASNDEFFA